MPVQVFKEAVKGGRLLALDNVPRCQLRAPAVPPQLWADRLPRWRRTASPVSRWTGEQTTCSATLSYDIGTEGATVLPPKHSKAAEVVPSHLRFGLVFFSPLTYADLCSVLTWDIDLQWDYSTYAV